MQPTATDVHVDTLMADIAIRLKNMRYIGERLFPTIRVKKKSDKYVIFKKGSWFRDEAGIRPPGGRARRGGYVITTGNYSAEEWAFAKEIPDEIRANADAPLQPDQEAVEFATDKVMIRKERAVASLVTTAGNWTSFEDAEGGWAATSSNTFMADVIKGIQTILGLTGLRPNKLMIDYKTFYALQVVSDIVDRIKYTGTGDSPATVTARTLAALFQLDEVLIGEQIYSSAEEVVAGTDFTKVDIWETNAAKGCGFLFYAPPSPSLRIPSSGYIFNWPSDELAGLNIAQEHVARGVRRWREPAEHQDVVEAFENFDAEATAEDLGYLFTDTYAT